ncbi:MAG: hypothetical protein Tsb009_28840 [Planctomycetaceae bacterium]
MWLAISCSEQEAGSRKGKAFPTIVPLEQTVREICKDEQDNATFSPQTAGRVFPIDDFKALLVDCFFDRRRFVVDSGRDDFQLP